VLSATAETVGPERTAKKQLAPVIVVVMDVATVKLVDAFASMGSLDWIVVKLPVAIRHAVVAMESV
jgi:hypothetical protein